MRLIQNRSALALLKIALFTALLSACGTQESSTTTDFVPPTSEQASRTLSQATFGPSLEEIATTLGPKAKIVKINIDENPQTPSKFGVRGIPTLMVFKDGKLASTKVGALPKNQLQSWIEQSI